MIDTDVLAEHESQLNMVLLPKSEEYKDMGGGSLKECTVGT